MEQTGRAGVLLLLCFLTLTAVIPAVQAEPDQNHGGAVYWIPLDQEVEQGLTRFLERGFREAQQAGAEAIVLEMDTLGGDVAAALEIGKLLRSSKIPVTVYIKGEAISAGSYIALNADHILMAPGSAMGAAEPRTITGERADPKTVAFWTSNMRAAAEVHGRDPEIAAGMVERNLEIKGLKKKGELLSLSAGQAIQQKMADRMVKGDADVLRFVGAHSSDVIRVDQTLSEQVARFVTSPYVIPVLFMVGLAGLAIEFLTPGFGLPGFIGLGAFGLYFFGHYLAGLAGVETFVLFAAGLILLLIEIFVPVFGIFGILGLLSLAASVVAAAADRMFSLSTLVVALLLTVVGMVIAVRQLGLRGGLKRFVLNSVQENTTGYVTQPGRRELIGKQGKALSPLRPAGTAAIEGKRVDVVSEGGFIPPHTPVKVVDVQGLRVVVRALSVQDGTDSGSR